MRYILLLLSLLSSYAYSGSNCGSDVLINYPLYMG